jgi:hypothetical protein
MKFFLCLNLVKARAFLSDLSAAARPVGRAKYWVAIKVKGSLEFDLCPLTVTNKGLLSDQESLTHYEDGVRQ